MRGDVTQTKVFVCTRVAANRIECEPSDLLSWCEYEDSERRQNLLGDCTPQPTLQADAKPGQRMGKKTKRGRDQVEEEAPALLDRRLPCGLNAPSITCAVLYVLPCGGSLYSLGRIFLYGFVAHSSARQRLLAHPEIDEKSKDFTVLTTAPWLILLCFLWFSFGHIWLSWKELGQLLFASFGMRMAGPPLLGSEEFEELLTEALDETNGDVNANPSSMRHSLPLQELRASYRQATEARKQGRQNERAERRLRR